MSSMKQLSILIATIACVSVADAAFAQQMIPPGWSQFNPPPLAPPPSPKIEVPVVPRMNVPSQPHVQASRRSSFSDRINRCLDEAAAAGYGPGKRAAYSRACANR
ncbi:hypothetical protein [Bradyrhizobium canariense]|uniref:Uncharacterized protein n=1 Tax=Bradyrhizobium canariense TaxID=255045 RepID=A0A1H1NS48_9BRAD|nr:hypothetical protein [Bradyrhizobium canariense]SDS01209.1 hypothetical protein SAMN05444158_0721 [Bradyrhizobium canariense]